MPGIAGRLKRRRLSRAAKHRCPPGRRCRVDGRPTGRTRGAILVSSHGCTAVERTSGLRGNAPPFAGRRGNLGPSGGSPRVRARRLARCAHNAREDFRLPLPCTHDERGVRNRFEKGTRSAERRREPLLGSVRSRGPPSPEGRPRGSSARTSPRGGGRRRRRLEVRHPLTQHEEAARLVVSARASSHCRNSAGRPRAQRSAPSVSVGSKAWPLHGAREREPDHRRRSGA